MKRKRTFIERCVEVTILLVVVIDLTIIALILRGCT